MGILLKLFNFTKEEESIPDVYINFEDVTPLDEEKQLIENSQETTTKIPTILDMMRTYLGASDMIRKSIANPKDQQLQDSTWESLQPLLVKLKEFSEFSTKINELFPTVLKDLCKEENFVDTVEKKPATIKLFAQIIDFSFRFDEMKMGNPAVQNDLSYYRRVLSHGRSSLADEELIIHRDEANKISMFLASPTPFFTSLIQLINQSFGAAQTPTLKSATTFFSTLVKISRHTLENPELSSRIKDESTKDFILRFMVGLIIMFDHTDEFGAFSKSSPFDIKSCIKIIKEAKNVDVQSLLNAIKYTCKHVNDESTPSAVKEMLDG